MGTPINMQARYDATYDWAGLTVRQIVEVRYTLESWILDVGAGWGKYRDLLQQYPNMDACEVWGPYIEENNLRGRYRRVHYDNVANLREELRNYDVVIFGDVLEHMTAGEARATLAFCNQAIVVVPFEYPQGVEEGNPFEIHIQADLTPEIMKRRYSALAEYDIEYRDGRPFKGCYLKEH